MLRSSLSFIYSSEGGGESQNTYFCTRRFAPSGTDTTTLPSASDSMVGASCPFTATTRKRTYPSIVSGCVSCQFLYEQFQDSNGATATVTMEPVNWFEAGEVDGNAALLTGELKKKARGKRSDKRGYDSHTYAASPTQDYSQCRWSVQCGGRRAPRTEKGSGVGTKMDHCFPGLLSIEPK